MSIASKEYIPLTVTSTNKIEDNSYQISLKNDNDYEISFSCEDIHSIFNINCSVSKISAKTSTNIVVDLDFNENANLDAATPNPNGSGYITKLGIRITYPYAYPEADPHYVESDEMVVTKLTITNLAEYITNSANTDVTNLARDNTTNLRYIGANPNNYVSFNNERWRILGVVDGKVKIMRTKQYDDNLSFYDGSASGTNTKFQDAAIKKELNDTFYYTINSKSRSMIKEGNWNVGGLSWVWQLVNTAYNTEKSTTISANVGLISTTDYVYAIGGSNRDSCIQSKGIAEVSSCKADNWIYPYAETSGMWTINGRTDVSGQAYVVNTLGNIAPNEIKWTSSAYPVVYLDESVGFSSGNGTYDSPYNLKSNSQTIVSNSYKDYITNVYVDSWGNALSGFAGKEITSFDKTGGALLFNNDTWGIPAEYKITQVTVYSFNEAELASYQLSDAYDNGTWHGRPSSFVFKRQVAPDLNYIGSEALGQHNGTLRFVIIVKSS